MARHFLAIFARIIYLNTKCLLLDDASKQEEFKSLEKVSIRGLVFQQNNVKILLAPSLFEAFLPLCLHLNHCSAYETSTLQITYTM